jgi:hypothetical protein
MRGLQRHPRASDVLPPIAFVNVKHLRIKADDKFILATFDRL